MLKPHAYPIVQLEHHSLFHGDGNAISGCDAVLSDLAPDLGAALVKHWTDLEGDGGVSQDRDVNSVCFGRITTHVTMDLDGRDGRRHVRKLHADNAVQISWANDLRRVSGREE